jgi:hypothetical protein
VSDAAKPGAFNGDLVNFDFFRSHTKPELSKLVDQLVTVDQVNGWRLSVIHQRFG